MGNRFKAEQKARALVVTHLRNMASAAIHYEGLADAHPVTRSVWLAAADFIEDDGKRQRKEHRCDRKRVINRPVHPARL